MFVVKASVMPTSVAVNPSLTIAAEAFRGRTGARLSSTVNVNRPSSNAAGTHVLRVPDIAAQRRSGPIMLIACARDVLQRAVTLSLCRSAFLKLEA
ncbi:hypothetical protein [Bradyrhizobium yuanmingense]|uniref:hypothetical protein n=1 Tax=Bradyrhizobium yuanmingense TaxID=108015 RepID=UPI001FEF144E|nr:hypothetical protein [Bradyrhizobium yuanmingense]